MGRATSTDPRQDQHDRASAPGALGPIKGFGMPATIRSTVWAAPPHCVDCAASTSGAAKEVTP